MKHRSMACLFLLASILACTLPIPPEEELACASFEGFNANDNLGNSVEINGVIFRSLGGLLRAADLVVVIEDDVKGLQIPVPEEGFGEGIRIDLPSPSPSITLKTVAYGATPIEVIAHDDPVIEDSNVVAQASVPADATVHTITLANASIPTVVVTGGNNQGIIVEICR